MNFARSQSRLVASTAPFAFNNLFTNVFIRIYNLELAVFVSRVFVVRLWFTLGF
jgi:hypothetical protein